MSYKEKALQIKDDLIRDIARVVNIKSVQEDELPGKPFGEGPYNALNEALRISQEMGFETVNLDNYCGYAQMGEGEELIGILGHMDVVPEGEGWETDPYEMVVKDGKLFGRGVCDDKGPSIAGLYAMKLVRESGVKLNKRVRFVFGANEETGMGCMKHYKEVITEPFTYGFTPDADFPLIFGEKGLYGSTFSMKLKKKGALKLVEVNGGEALNVVCPKCIATLQGDSEKINEVKESFNKYCEAKKLEGFTVTEEGFITLSLTGVGAHASLPHLGRNAASHMFEYLGQIIDEPFVNGYNKLVGLDYNGRNCGAYVKDEYGEITFNIGVIKTENDVVSATIDIRYPITVDFHEVDKIMQDNFANEGFDYVVRSFSDSLFIDPESALVKTLYESYVEATGDDSLKPMTIGGGTYAKSFANMVAFGPEFPGSENNIHMANETFKVDDLLKAVDIYATAIEKLLAL